MRFLIRTRMLLHPLALLVSACGGGGGGESGSAPPPAPAAVAPTSVSASAEPLKSTMTAIQAPECIADTAGRWMATVTQSDRVAAPSPPAKKFFMAVRYVHAIDTPITSNFGRFGDLQVTNFDPEAGVERKDYGRWQRGGVDGNLDQTSGFQLKCDDVGSFINTSTVAPQKIVGGGPHSAYFYDFRDPAEPNTLSKLPPVYDTNANTDFVLQASVQVPMMKRSGPADNVLTGSLAVTQLSMGAYFRDAETGNLFAYLVNLYQNRAKENPFVAHDEQSVFVSTPWQTSDYTTLQTDSAGYSSDTWSGLRLYRIHIPQDKFKVALSRVNAFCAAPGNRDRTFCRPGSGGQAFSNDPLNYQLVTFGMLHEIFTGLPSNQIASGVHYKGVGAYRSR